jgi:diguanylate cyclase (GGDEF)-like protein
MTHAFEHAEAMMLLQVMPMGVIVTDQERIVWINPQAEELTGLNAQGLCGQPIEALPLWLKSIFVSGTERTLLTGESGCEVMVSLKRLGTGQVTMACFMSDSSEIKRLTSTVTEMGKELELLATRDESSGLLNQRGLYQVIESQVSRSRRYGNDLSLISMQIHDYGPEINDKSPIHVALGYLFNDRLRWSDSVGRIEEDEFIMVLPETNAASTTTLVGKLKTELMNLRLNDIGEPQSLGVSFGIATWQEGDDPSRLLLRCQEDRQ